MTANLRQPQNIRDEKIFRSRKKWIAIVQKDNANVIYIIIKYKE